MALRFRTRLTLTNTALIFSVIAVMTIAVTAIFVMDMFRRNWNEGATLHGLANRNIEYGLVLPQLVAERVEDQMKVSALLAAELAALDEKHEAVTSDEISQAFDRVVESSAEIAGYPLIQEIRVEETNSPSAGTSDSGSSGQGRIAVRGASPLYESLKDQFDVQGFVDRFMLREEFRLIAVISPDGETIAAIDQQGRQGSDALTGDILKFSTSFLESSTDEYALQMIPAEYMYDFGVVTRLGSGDNLHALYVQHPTASAFAYILGRVWVIMTVGFVMFIVGLFVSILLSRSLAKPIVHLTTEVDEFAKGNLNHRIRWNRNDEFHDLAETFNTMAISLQEYMHELEQETSRRERLESEFRIAAQMQKALLPETPPIVEELELVGWSMPSREVGGDYYDYIELEPGVVMIALGDATGKGVSAALLITQCSSVLRTLTHETHSPGELLKRTNNEFFKRIGATYRFVTLFLITVDVNKGTLKYATAGHPPPVLISGETGAAQKLKCASSFPLGIVDQADYEEREISLGPQDTIVVYSDGLTDARNRDNEFYGEDRIGSVLESTAARPTGEVLQALRQDAEKHMHGREATDDMTIVVTRFNPKVPAAVSQER